MNKKRMVINMLAQITSLLVNIVLNFVLTPYITSNVGKEAYGYINLGFQFTGYISIFTIALNSVLSRFVMIKMEKKELKMANAYFTSVTYANIILSIILIIPMTFLVLGLENVIDIPNAYLYDIKLLWTFILLGFILNMAFVSFGIASFISDRMDLSSKRNIESNLLKSLIIILCYFLFVPKVWYFGIAYCISIVFILLSNVYYAKKLTPMLKLNKKYFSFKALKEVFVNGIWSSINQLSNVLISGLDMLITNVMLGATQMALMGFAKAMPVYIIMILSMLSNTLTPHLTRVYSSGNMKKFVKDIIFFMKVSGFVCSVPVIGLMCYGTDFFNLWLPVLTNREVATVQILSVLSLVYLLFDVYLYPLYSVNLIMCKLKIPVMVNLAIGVFNIIGTLLLLKYTNIGIYAIQIVSAFFMVLKVIIFSPLFASNILNVKPKVIYNVLIKGSISTIINIVLFIFVRSILSANNWFEFFINICIAGILGYGISFFVIFNKEEKKNIFGTAFNKIRGEKI